MNSDSKPNQPLNSEQLSKLGEDLRKILSGEVPLRKPLPDRLMTREDMIKNGLLSPRAYVSFSLSGKKPARRNPRTKGT